MPGSPYNVGRVLTTGRANQVGDRIRQVTTQGSAPQYFRAVVLDVLFDPGILSETDITALKNSVANPEFVDNMPPNSVVARLVSGGQEGTPLPSLVYPFFQSHFLLPIQSGEHVQVIFEDFQQNGSVLGRWVTRIHENQAVEDLNFTHADRRFNTTNNPSTERTSTAADRGNGTSQPPPVNFPNGGGTPDSYTLPTSGSVNPYEDIYNNSLGSATHTYEAVPRFTKRPQELVLQGMNNSLIVLGTDRNGAARRPSGGVQSELRNYAGSVDMVVGRGRYPLTPDDTAAPDSKPTSALVVTNTRDKLEVDKNPRVRNKTANPREGDPDFKTDAARLFLCMNTKGDTNFGLLNGTGNDKTSYADNTVRSKEQGNGSEPTAASERVGNAYLVGKADHLRFVARKAEVPGGGNIKGSVLLLKEGTKDADQAYLYINQDGMLQLEAKRIFLGKAVTGGSVDATDHQEPYIKWTKFKETVDGLHDEINTLKQAISQLKAALNQAGPTSLCQPYGSDAAWTTIQTSLPAVEATLNQVEGKQNTTNNKVTQSKSTKIFGE